MSDARSGGPCLFSRSHRKRSLFRRRRHARVGQPICLSTSQLWRSWRGQRRTERAIASWTRSRAMRSRLRQPSQRAEAYSRAGRTTPTYSRLTTSSAPLRRASLFRTKILNCCRWIMLLICSDQDRVLVSVTPRWRVDSAKGISFEFNNRTGEGLGVWRRCFRRKSMCTVLLALNEVCHSSAQSLISWRSRERLHVHTLAEEEAAGIPLQQSCINVSSANMAVLLVETAGRSR